MVLYLLQQVVHAQRRVPRTAQVHSVSTCQDVVQLVVHKSTTHRNSGAWAALSFTKRHTALPIANMRAQRRTAGHVMSNPTNPANP